MISHGHFGEVDLDHHRSSSPVLNQLYQAVDTDHGVKYSVRPTSAINASIATKRPDTIQIVHPNLLARIDTIEMDCVRFEVYEHVSCELSQWIRQTSGDRLNESVAKMITSQLLSAVDFLHSRYMIHQSIDIHNVLVRHLTQSSVFLVKLMFSTKSGPIRVTRRWRNVSPYASEFVPDLWSIGALVHHLLCGHQTVDVCQSLDFLKISQTVFEFPTHLWHSISSNAIQFICQLVSLKHNRKPNVTARSMQLHSWIKVSILIRCSMIRNGLIETDFEHSNMIIGFN